MAFHHYDPMVKLTYENISSYGTSWFAIFSERVFILTRLIGVGNLKEWWGLFGSARVFILIRLIGVQILVG